MIKVISTILLFICVYSLCLGQEKIRAFSLIGQQYKTLKKEKQNLVFGFNGGYTRAKFKPPLDHVICAKVEITFYQNQPLMSKDTLFISMIDAPNGKMDLYESRMGGIGGYQYIFSLKTTDKFYAIVCNSIDGKLIETILISEQ